MRKSIAASALAIGLLVLLVASAGAAPTISITGDNKGSYPNGGVPRYEKFEVSFTIGGVGTPLTDYNPFNPNLTQLSSDYWNKKGILVDAILTSPGGQTMTWPAFYYDSGVWKLRFSPTETGTWKYKLTVKHSSGDATSPEYSFNCVASSNRGFIRVNPADPRFFQFSDGTPYYPVGCDTTGINGTDWIGQHRDVFSKMSQYGGNFSRLFASVEWISIEPYAISGDHSTPKALNNYNLGNAKKMDQTLDLARQYGVYVQVLLDDWTRWKGADSQYIRAGSRAAPCGNYGEVYNGTNGAREIYKRKIRYMAARFGYSTNLLNLELMNENYGSSGDITGWHKEMGNYIQSFTAQPHMASSSNGSYRLRTSAGIPWTDPSMSYVNFHGYAIPGGHITWSSLEGDGATWEKMGSTLSEPWMDTAVWIERTARAMYKIKGWKKPFIWSEYGLETIDSSGIWRDWSAAYKADPGARHAKDAMWAGMFATAGVIHWKAGYILGTFEGGPEKFWIYGPMSNFLVGEDFTGLVQETAYPVADSRNPNPQVYSSNSKIMAVSLHGPTKAYAYVKNLTDCWYRFVSSGSVPTPANQSGTVSIGGMEPGTYTVEKWSTSDTNKSTQKKDSYQLTVGSDGVAKINVNVGVGTDFDWAYKIKKASGTVVNPPNIEITMAADRSSAKPGEVMTYTVNYKNTGVSTATNVVITVSVPGNTTYVTGSGGTLSGGAVTWSIPSLAAGASGIASFKATVN